MRAAFNVTRTEAAGHSPALPSASGLFLFFRSLLSRRRLETLSRLSLCGPRAVTRAVSRAVSPGARVSRGPTAPSDSESEDTRDTEAGRTHIDTPVRWKTQHRKTRATPHPRATRPRPRRTRDSPCPHSGLWCRCGGPGGPTGSETISHTRRAGRSGASGGRVSRSPQRAPLGRQRQSRGTSRPPAKRAAGPAAAGEEAAATRSGAARIACAARRVCRPPRTLPPSPRRRARGPRCHRSGRES
mmetsp:Transcript_25879/g.77284  ORF Transcript_25879/g.77284 Transcript_25879/m.77284 type:complete len:243 (-) Transcript_25879:234-962(-)